MTHTPTTGPASRRAMGAAAALLAAIILAAPATAQIGQQRDRLENGGFEDGLTGWQPDAKQQLITEAKQAHSGKQCLFGEVTQPKQALTLKRTVSVKACNLYEFEIWARATQQTKLVLWVVKPGKAQREIITAWERVPAKWHRYSVPITVDMDGRLELQIIAPSSHGAPAGKIWIDDVALHETLMPDARELTDNKGFDDEPAAARAADGSLYVLWNRFAGGSDSIHAARYSRRDGSLQREAEWTVDGPGKGRDARIYCFHPAVAATAGGATAVYAREVAENDWDLMVAELSPAGVHGPEPLLKADGIDIKPTLGWHDGTLWTAWESNRSGIRQVFAVSRRDGRTGTPQALSRGDASAYAPSMAILSTGEVCVAWHEYRDSNYDIYMRRCRDGNWGPEQRLTFSPVVDRHARLAARGDVLWLAYERALIKGYRIGATNDRALRLVQVQPDGTLLAPKGMSASPLKGRSEAAAPAVDAQGRVWLAHLRPRGRRNGWDTFITAFTGAAWTPRQRVSSKLGMDRRPALVIDGDRAVVISQSMPVLTSYANEKDAEKIFSSLTLSDIAIADTPPPTPLALEPWKEPTPPDEMAAAIRKQFGDADRQARSIDYQGRRLHLAYGDLHEHTDVSQCNRLGDQSVDESYQHMRDIGNHDFAAVTDHGYNLTPYFWNYTAKMARINYDPGHFLTFLGEEWTSTFEEYSDKHPYGFYGHRNLIFGDAYLPRWWNARNRQTPAEVWTDLRAMKANFVHIPHQLADTGNVPTDWDFADETAQPVAEILQVRGSYEYKGAPREAKRSTPKGYFMQDAWARGIVIGVIASPDHGGGAGKACVYVPELTRAAVLDALRARHCFGSSGARIFLDVRVNGHLMGEKIAAPDGKPVRVDIKVDCPGDIARIDVCRNNEFIYTKEPGGRTASLVFTDTQPVAGKSYYYVRVIQADDELAWSSPVWLGYD